MVWFYGHVTLATILNQISFMVLYRQNCFPLKKGTSRHKQDKYLSFRMLNLSSIGLKTTANARCLAISGYCKKLFYRS